MKKKLLFFSLFLVILLGILFSFTAFGRARDALVRVGETARPATLLILGLDDAAQNTDVVLLARYDPNASRLAFLQLPRDTYLENGEEYPKLNHIYAASYARTQDNRLAAKETAACLAASLGVQIDGCVTLRFSALARLVDRLGGIPMDLPFEMEYEDPAQNLRISLPKGKTVLNGEQAVWFVRYRSGYVEGDLGRVDAQKLFLSAFMKRMQESFGPKEILAFLQSPFDGMTVVFEEKSALLPIILNFYQNRDGVERMYMSLPGEATQENGNSGAWYYVANRQASGELLTTYFGRKGSTFDPDGRFYTERVHFENIYFDRSLTPRIYAEEDLEKIKIQTKE